MPDPSAIPIICGPTASGKTAAIVALAGEFPLEVVSADSRQMIRGLNIGTAKPTEEERTAVPFHLLDILEPGERYSAFRFIEDASRAIADILERECIPVVVGGTGLYLRALTEGVVEIEIDDSSIRSKLEQEMEQLGPDQMHRRLQEVDPEEAAGVHPNNRVRVIRALEMYEATGLTKTELLAKGTARRSPYAFEYFLLTPPRERLYGRIDERVEMMMAEGLLEELQELVAQGRGVAVRRANVIGYNELMDCLDGSRRLDEAVALIKQNSRRYAKRQLTWLRHQADGLRLGTFDELLSVLRARLRQWSPPSATGPPVRS